MDPSVRYKLDATARVRNPENKEDVYQIIQGMGVVRHKTPLGLRFETRGRFDLVHVNTCGRSEETEKENKQYAIVYSPDPDVEASGECLMTVSGYDSKQNKHAFLLLAFEDSYPHLNMEAEVACNAKRTKSKIEACQSQADTQIRIAFDEYTVIDVETPSDLPKELMPAVASDCRSLNIDGTPINNEEDIARMVYQFPIPAGVCVYNFVDLLTGEKASQVITYGFDEIAIREF